MLVSVYLFAAVIVCLVGSKYIKPHLDMSTRVYYLLLYNMMLVFVLPISLLDINFSHPFGGRDLSSSGVLEPTIFLLVICVPLFVFFYIIDRKRKK